MPKCPKCGTAGAYVGFSEIECRNHRCDHYKFGMKPYCTCCGGEHEADDCKTGEPEQEGPPSMFSADNYSSPPPDWHGD